MYFRSKVLLLVLICLAGSFQSLEARTQFVPPWAPNLAPQWAPIPQVPGVYYVPNLGHDLFRYANQFYFYRNGQWLLGDGPQRPLERDYQSSPRFSIISGRLTSSRRPAGPRARKPAGRGNRRRRDR